MPAIAIQFAAPIAGYSRLSKKLLRDLSVKPQVQSAKTITSNQILLKFRSFSVAGNAESAKVGVAADAKPPLRITQQIATSFQLK
jgi:hypothetical protein